MGSGKLAVGIPTLEALAARAWEWPPASDERPLIYPMLDARRGEVYVARYRRGDDGEVVRDGEELLVRPEEFLSQITGSALFLGGGAVLHRALIIERLGGRALFPPIDRPELMAPSAAAVARLAWRRWRDGGAVDPAELTAVHLRPAVMPPPAPEITRA
jgi:tRNA threonylcarbamoyladenosine biosynthesis protein TsaB